MTRIAKKQENKTHNEAPSHSIKTDPELAHMLEIDDDMKTLIITIIVDIQKVTQRHGATRKRTKRTNTTGFQD